MPLRSQLIMCFCYSISVSVGIVLGIGVSAVYATGSPTSAWVLVRGPTHPYPTPYLNARGQVFPGRVLGCERKR